LFSKITEKRTEGIIAYFRSVRYDCWVKSIRKIFKSIAEHPLILPLYLPTIIVGLCWGMQEPLMPLFARDMGASYSLVGLFLSGQAIGMLLSDLPGGVTLRWLGQKRSMLVGLSLMTVAMLTIVWARNIYEAVICQLVIGVGFAVFGIARHAYIADKVNIRSRGRAVALFGGINRIGRFAGPALGGSIAELYGIRTPFYWISGSLIITIAIVMLFLPVERNKHLSSFGEIRTYWKQMIVVAKEYKNIFTTVGAGQLFAQMVRSGPRILIPLYAADILGLDVGSIGWIVSIGAAIDMTLFYPVGVIMDRFGRKFAIIPSFLIQGIALFLIPLAGTFTSLAFVAGLIGFGNGLGSGTMMTLGADLAPLDRRGEFLGIWRLIGDGGSFAGPLIAGSVASLFALPIASFVMGVSGFLSTTIFLFLVPETNRGD